MVMYQDGKNTSICILQRQCEFFFKLELFSDIA